MFKEYKALKGIYEKSILTENAEELLKSNDYFNRADEWLIKEIGVGYLMMALDCHEGIKEKLTDEDIDNLIYAIACCMDDEPFTTAIAQSKKYNLHV